MEEVGHKLCMDNWGTLLLPNYSVTCTTELLALALFGIMEGMTPNFGPRALIRKKEDIVNTVHSKIIAVYWKDKRGT